MRHFLLTCIIAIIFATVGYFLHPVITRFFSDTDLTSPFVAQKKEPERPLLAFSIQNLKNRVYIPSSITIEKELASEEKFVTYMFSYTTLGKKMTGQLNIPTEVKLDENGRPKVIILVRGYVPLEIFSTGVGTKNAAAEFARNGYVTLAPDFFGYGESDAEPEDTWQARFEKPVVVIELIKTVQTSGVPTTPVSNSSDNDRQSIISYTPHTTSNIGMWAHSNGGQITLATLQVLSERLPATLWAPVTAPFPYSVLYFTDEESDEGKAARKNISLFEETYDVFDFTLTQHLDLLTGPLQIHHGTADEAAPIIWSDEFVQKVKAENDRRTELRVEQEVASATTSAHSESITPELQENIVLEYFTYTGGNHNMQPGWNEAITRDVEFFEKWL